MVCKGKHVIDLLLIRKKALSGKGGNETLVCDTITNKISHSMIMTHLLNSNLNPFSRIRVIDKGPC